ncbi:epoxide hydrolase family protein [Sphingomonas crocodyli]|uniref:Epoxide hydrolase n=1 Tax=Sphingomonas crocodyli TaxID=1979270 RepID=A0A437M8C8_9SPHN|nr:epoxide hydrolase family protein [Sphingomonas crocodyli]RVT93826.1 epoxide hydrolase [Sphingomonas crocodyli]
MTAPAPFRFAAEAAMIEDLKARLANSRAAPVAVDPDGGMGIAPVDLARLKAGFEAFDWAAFEARANRHPAFTLPIRGQTTHFVRVTTGAAADRLPLLLLHGWPGSYLEFGDAIDLLIASGKPLDIVCPSLPGYGFSTRDLESDLPPRGIGDVMVDLMAALGHDRFVVQGGDWGSVIASEMGRFHADRLIGVHVNMVPMMVMPGDPIRETATETEKAWIARSDRMRMDGSGYQAIQGTRPQTLAVGLADSPLGLLAWIGEKFIAWSGRDAAGKPLARDQHILDGVALYWATNCIGSSVRLYRDMFRNPSSQAPITPPCGIANYPYEIMKSPRSIVEPRYNIVHWAEPEMGGHFAAMEVPDLFVADLLAFLEKLP